MRAALDQVAQASGLGSVRDWIVLAALTAEPGRTQLALAHDLGLDKPGQDIVQLSADELTNELRELTKQLLAFSRRQTIG